MVTKKLDIIIIPQKANIAQFVLLPTFNPIIHLQKTSKEKYIGLQNCKCPSLELIINFKSSLASLILG